MVDLKAQYSTIKTEIDAAIQRVVSSTSFIMGPEVTGFEQAFSPMAGASYSVGVASGTAALHLALLACGIGRGDEVITTPFTFFATGEAISQTGATPVFVDAARHLQPGPGAGGARHHPAHEGDHARPSVWAGGRDG